MKLVFPFAPSDAALVARTIGDEPEAFEALVLRYQKKAHALARCAGVRSDDLEDVVQESFLSALWGLASLREPASFGGWFLSIVRNNAREHLRKAKQQPAALDNEQAGRPAEPPEERDFRHYLWRKVAELPSGTREAIFLYYHDGKSLGSVARSLGITRSGVKYRLREGRNILRGRLWREMERCFRDVLPPESDWRRRGRTLAFMAMLSVPASGTARTMPGSAAPASTSDSTDDAGSPIAIHDFPIGLQGMIGMKSFILLAVALIALAGGVTLVRTPWRGTPADLAPPQGPVALAPSEPPAGVPEIPPAAGRPTGVRGVVFLEKNGLPLPGASISACPIVSAVAAATVASQADGRYEITGLKPGQYYIWAWKGNWTTDHLENITVRVVDGEVASANRTLILGATIAGVVLAAESRSPLSGATVSHWSSRNATTDSQGRFKLEGVPAGTDGIISRAPGFSKTNLEVGVQAGEEAFIRILLPPSGIIEGRVTGLDGKPVPGARTVASAGRFSYTETTNREGRYRIDGVDLAARNFTVRAGRDDLYWSTAEVSGYPPGQTKIDLDLKLEKGYAIEGKVVSPEGQPIEGAGLYMMIRGREASPVRTTDQEGHFRIEGVSDWLQQITALKKGFAPATRFFRDIRPEERESLELVLGPGHFLAGTVVDKAGNPLENAWVYADIGVYHYGRDFDTRTDRDGRFRIEDLPEKLQGIAAARRGFAESRGNVASVDRDDNTIVLDRESAGQIQGVVVEAKTGRPLSPYSLKLHFSSTFRPQPGSQKGAGLRSDWSREGIHFGSADGRFEVRDLCTGVPYGLLVTTEGMADGYVDAIEAWALNEERDPIRIEVEAGGELPGQVVDSRTGKPIAGVNVRHVTMHSPNHWDPWENRHGPVMGSLRQAWTDQDGRFRLEGLSKKAGVLLLEKSGFARTTIADLTADDAGRLFSLNRQAAVEGTVRTAGGEPVAGVEVIVTAEKKVFPRAITDAQGSFQVAGLPAGDTTVTVFRFDPKRLPQTREVKLVEGETQALEFVVGPSAIVGRVTNGRKDVPDAQVLVLRSGEPEEQAWIHADGEGRFRVEGLRRGEYQLSARESDERGWPREHPKVTVEVRAGEVEIDLPLLQGPPSEFEVGGRVIDKHGGRPVERATIQLFAYRPEESIDGVIRIFPDGWAPAGEKVVEDGGAFHFASLPSGRYLLAARVEGAKAASGWAGPFDLQPGSSATDLDVPVGGNARLEVTVLDARNGGPVEKAFVALVPEGRLPSRWGGSTDSTGKLSITEVAAGRYHLRVGSDLHLDVEEVLDVPETTERDPGIDRTVLLEPASWIVIELAGPAALEKRHRVIATLLSGDDPGWSLRRVEGDLPVEFGRSEAGNGAATTYRVKTHPGKYRIRLDAAALEMSLKERPLASREVDVEVPEDGEVSVQLDLPPPK